MRIFGLSMDHLGLSMDQLGLSMDHLGLSMDHLGLSMDHLGISMDHLGISMDHLGISMDHLISRKIQLKYHSVLQEMWNSCTKVFPTQRMKIMRRVNMERQRAQKKKDPPAL